MNLRRLAGRWLARGERLILAVGLLGMLGFVLSALALMQRLVDAASYFVATLLSLAAYSFALAIGYFGDPQRAPPPRELRS